MITLGHARSERKMLQDALDAGVRAPTVLSWAYDSPALVLGRGQKATPELRERAGCAGLEIVERASGGGTVLAGPWMLSCTLLLPATDPVAQASLPAGYRAVGTAWRAALARFGVATELAAGAARSAASAGPNSGVPWACFASLSHGELVTSPGRKIVGIAQVRRRDVVAICCGVLLSRPDWELLINTWLGTDDPDSVDALEEGTDTCDRWGLARDPATLVALSGTIEAQLLSQRAAA